MQLQPPTNPQGALPLHLTLAMLPWLASLTALPLSKNGLSDLNMILPESQSPAAGKLKEAWAALLKDPKLAQAAEKESRKRAAEFLEGLHQYQQMRFTRDVSEPESVFSCGNARLLSYGGEIHAPAVLLIPSLINRYYILDLTSRLSFARYLRANGFNVFVVDWGAPGDRERHFTSALYVTETLVPMAEWMREHTAGPVVTTGYCMGGLLALALAQIRPDLTDAAAFLATPWNFLAPEFPRFSLTPHELSAIREDINSRDLISAEIINTLFHCANPFAFQCKLRQFVHMDKEHPATQEFLAVEHWVNDGVPMTRGVAQDCLIEWTQLNTPANGRWRVGGQVINPTKINKPCLVAVPRDDKIVPHACALPLAGLLCKSTLLEPRSGHVGMMVGSRRKASLWEPFVEWVEGI